MSVSENSPLSEYTVRVSESDFKRLLEERDHLRKQVNELRDDLNAKTNASLARQVRAFHIRFGHPVATTPAVPDDAQVRFRLKLITEEFFEMLAACEIWPMLDLPDGEEMHAKDMIVNAIEADACDFKSILDMPEFADALVDLAWVIEGTQRMGGSRARRSMTSDSIRRRSRRNQRTGSRPISKDVSERRAGLVDVIMER